MTAKDRVERWQNLRAFIFCIRHGNAYTGKPGWHQKIVLGEDTQQDFEAAIDRLIELEEKEAERVEHATDADHYLRCGVHKRTTPCDCEACEPKRAEVEVGGKVVSLAQAVEAWHSQHSRVSSALLTDLAQALKAEILAEVRKER